MARCRSGTSGPPVEPAAGAGAGAKLPWRLQQRHGRLVPPHFRASAEVSSHVSC